MSRQQILDSCNRIQKKIEAEQYDKNVMVGGARRRRRMTGGGLVASPAQYGYGNIAGGGCNIYGGARKPKYTLDDVFDTSLTIPERSKIITRELKKQIAKGTAPGDARRFKLDAINQAINNGVIPRDVGTYALNKVEAGYFYYIPDNLKIGQEKGPRLKGRARKNYTQAKRAERTRFREQCVDELQPCRPAYNQCIRSRRRGRAPRGLQGPEF